LASTKKTVKELIQDLHADVGVYLTRRVNIHADPAIVTSLRNWFTSKPPVSINGLNVHRIVELDGFKFIFHGGSWLGVRFSGTEPIVRFYYEANSEKQLDVLAAAGESLIKSSRTGAGPKKALAHH
jgi:phosphoglucomutase